jgi:hypothetical protein
VIRALDRLRREGRTRMGHPRELPGLARIAPGLVNQLLQVSAVGHDVSSRAGRPGEEPDSLAPRVLHALRREGKPVNQEDDAYIRRES